MAWRGDTGGWGLANLSVQCRHKARKLGGLGFGTSANIKHNMHTHTQRQISREEAKININS